MTTTKRQTFEQRMQDLIPAGDGPFEITAFELTHDGECWSVNTPFNIGRNLDRSETIGRLRDRWEIFKANYLPKARVSDLCSMDFGDIEEESQIEVDCTAFVNVRKIAD